MERRPINPVEVEKQLFAEWQAQMQGKDHYDWETAPDMIPDDQISEVIDTDIVVLGCGLAGASATLSAAETGAKVLQLEKTESFNARGRGNFGFNSRVRPAIPGIENPTEVQFYERRNAIVKENMQYTGYRGSQALFNYFVDESGPIQNWILDYAEKAGTEVEVRDYEDPSKNKADFVVENLGGNQSFRYDVLFQPDGQITLVKMMVDTIETFPNVEQRFNTAGKMLITDDDGKVCGVIAQDQITGDYIKVNAKAVILATGGYEWDGEMMEKYGGSARYIASSSHENHGNTGDGLKMGMWVGGQMDEAPHCILYEDGGNYDLYTPKLYCLGVARKPWMAVDVFGERYDNEDKVWPMLGASDTKKPFHCKYVIWDDTWRDEATIEKMGSAHSYYSLFHGYTPELTEEKIADGSIITADTIDELVEKINADQIKRFGVANMDAETLKQQIERYNYCVDAGYDLDFDKPAKDLKHIKKPPYYATYMGASMLATLGGLKINKRMQILDDGWNPIEGLYGAGNVTGNMWYHDYPENIPGMTHARALIWGYHAAKNAYDDYVA